MSDPNPVGRAGEDAKRRLLDQIRSGALEPGAKLGGERDLARALGVSRSTVRQALAAMEREGVVRRIPGAASLVGYRRPVCALLGPGALGA